MDLGMHGKTVLITGGSRGIGFEAARILVAEGARVVVCARDAKRLDEAVAQLDAIEIGNVAGIAIDLRSAEAIKAMFQDVLARFGAIDALVNNASAFDQGSFANLSDADWEELIALKLFGTVRCCREALPHMVARRRGTIVNVSGIAGLEPGGANPHVGAINAAILNLTKGLSRAHAGDGIRVNAVTPGSTLTQRYHMRASHIASQKGCSVEEAMAELDSRLPLGKPVQPVEAGRLIAILVSDLMPSLTGQNFILDAGATHQI
jgi:3-oxoacyl-[acyl-carrier protein] reductase